MRAERARGIMKTTSNTTHAPSNKEKEKLARESKGSTGRTEGRARTAAGGNRAGDTYNTYAPAHGQLKTTSSTTQQQANKNLLTSLSSR